MTGKTLFGPDWYQDPNDNRIHDENGDDVLDKHSLGELQKIVNSHDALVAALKETMSALSDIINASETEPYTPEELQQNTFGKPVADAYAALEQASEQESQG